MQLSPHGIGLLRHYQPRPSRGGGDEDDGGADDGSGSGGRKQRILTHNGAGERRDLKRLLQ